MAVTEFVSASEFKAKCLVILNRFTPPGLERAVIPKVKHIAALLTPPGRHAEAVHNIHGFMRGTVIIAEDADLTAPLLEPDFAAPTLADDAGPRE